MTLDYEHSDPPENYFVMADCGHEVYDGENLYLWNEKTLCPDCMKDKVGEIPLSEIAVFLGAKIEHVSRKRATL